MALWVHGLLLNGTDVVNLEQCTKILEYLYCHEVEVVEYFELLGMTVR